MKKMAEGLRWAFGFGTWRPTREQWVTAIKSIQPEEKERIARFVFKKDAKSSLVC